jgi:WD40 repeat protein
MMKKNHFFLLLIVIMLVMLSACQQVEPTPTEVIESIETTTPEPTSTDDLLTTTATVTPTEEPRKITVEEIGRLGKGSIIDLAWSPDGTMVAVSTSIGLYMLDSVNLEEIYFIETNYHVWNFIFSSDGTLMAFEGDQDIIHIFDVKTRSEKQVLHDDNVKVGTLLFTPDNKTLISGGLSEFSFWDLETGKVTETWKGHNSGVRDLLISDDSSILISTSSNIQTGGMILIWDLVTSEIIASQDELYGVAKPVLSSDGAVLSYATNLGVYSWNFMTDEVVTISQRASYCELFCGYDVISSDMSYIVYPGYFGDIVVKDGKTNEEIYTIDEIEYRISAIIYSPDVTSFISSSDDGVIRKWDLLTGELLQSVDGFIRGIDVMCISPDGSTVTVGTMNGEIISWDIISMEMIQSINAYSNGFNALTYSLDGSVFASSAARDISIWNASTGELMHSFEVYGYRVRDLVFLPGKSFLASISDLRVQLWDTADEYRLTNMGGIAGHILILAAFSDGETIVSSGHNHTVDLWNFTEGKIVERLKGHQDYVYSLAFSPDDQFLASGSADGVIHIWDIATGEISYTLYGNADEGASIAFSPDGEFLLSGNYDGTIQIWDISTGSEVLILPSGGYRIKELVFSSDGTFFITASGDGTIRFWRIIEE